MRPYSDLPAAFRYEENRGQIYFRDARASVFSVKEAFEMIFDSVSSTKTSAKPTELCRGGKSIEPRVIFTTPC